MNRSLLAAAIAALVVGFGGGFLVAKGLDGGFRPSSAVAAGTPGATLWSMFGKPRSEKAPRRGIPKPEGFAVWKTRLDSSGAQPLACIQMSRALDPNKSYADFVLISPDLGHAPAVTVRGDELCVGGVGFADRRITLLKGLPGKGGETLAENADVDFTFGEKPPYVGFAGLGVILPREEADGVGIETINVTKLAIEVWRVPDRNLVRKSISAPDPTNEGDWADDWGEDSPDEDGRVVWKGFITVKGDPGAKVTTVFPLGATLREMKPGAYVIKAKDASGGRDLEGEDGEQSPAQARRWIMFTDMAVMSYTGENALDVVVRSLKSAKTLPGVQVSLVAKDGEDLAVARTDASGRATFSPALLKGEGASAPKMIMAYGPQGDLAVLDLDRSPVDLSKQDVGGRTAEGDDAGVGGRTTLSAIDGYLYADRGIYRPGETVRLVALVRDRDSKAVKDRKGYVVVKRPSGVEYRRFPFAGAPGGAVTTDVALPKSAPRGRWTAELKIDGIEAASGALSFSVEDFVPQRLAVKTAGDAARPVAGDEARAITVDANFLYGAVGAGLQTQGEARLRADPNPFPAKDLQGYIWGDSKEPFEEKHVDLGATVTDGEGRATLTLNGSEAGDTAVPVSALVTASVFEPGGRPVRESVTLKIRTRPMYLGVKVEDAPTSGGRDPVVNIDVVAVNGAGQRMAASGVTYTLISENWSYDWFQQDGKWQWRRTSRDAVVTKGTLNVAAGQPARIARRLGWGDYRLELEGADGVKSVRRFSSGWGAPSEDADAPDFVRVAAGKPTYAQGDTIELTLKAPYAGEAQVAVATDRLIDFQTAAISEKGGTIRLKTTAAWGGGAYLLVTVVQPRNPVSSPKPRRALGLIYVPLDPKGRRLTVDIGTPDKIDSKAPVEVPVHVQGLAFGQSARVTVAAVDSGILNLTKFETPDPVKWYFGKRALAVDYRDDYGRLLDPNLGAPANVNFGGDELGGEGLTVTPIKTVALWSGVVETGLDGKARVKLPAALFNGQVRIMAVAWTDSAVGSGDKQMTIREPVVADLNLPRFLAPGDKAFMTLELHNLEGKGGAYTATTSGTGGLMATFRKVFNLVMGGPRVRELIPFAAPNHTGVGKVSMNVAGPSFATAKDYDLETRLGWGPVTRTTTALQRPGESFTPSPAVMQGLAAGDITLQVSYSPIRGFDPGPIALALWRYPYGCTEQLVSTAYPLVYAGDFAKNPQYLRGVNEAVGKLLDRQTLDGAFGLWRVGDGEADAWLGAYATDFLLEAKARGAGVSDEAIDRALGAMRQISRPDGFASVSYRTEYPAWWGGSPEISKAATARMRSRASAYALYVLAKGGRGDLARLRWWHDVQLKNEPSPLAKAQIGAGLALMGDRARAHSAFVQAVQAVGYKRPPLRIGPILFVDDQDWYQTPLRDLAGVIALGYEAGEINTVQELVGRLDGAVQNPDSLNTQEQATLLRAAHFMIARAGPIRITASGATPMSAAGGTPRWAVGRLADARFVNAGTGALYRTVTVKGTPIFAPGAENAGISVNKSYYTMQGQPVDLASVRQGERVVVRVAGVSGQGRTISMAVNDALPAGFEIESLLGPDDAQQGPFKFLGTLTSPDVQEARDDRYVAAMDLAGHGSFAFAYIARAVTPGEFFMPGTQAIDMYRPSVAGPTAGARLVVASGP